MMINWNYRFTNMPIILDWDNLKILNGLLRENGEEKISQKLKSNKKIIIQNLKTSYSKNI